jgi:polysaccharide export outer membrane protein
MEVNSISVRPAGWWLLQLATLLVLPVLFCGCFGDGGEIQEFTPEEASSGATPQAGGESRPDIIRVGDVLVLRLTGVPDGEGGLYEEPVTDEGKISMPLVGQFKAAGKTPAELKKEIETAYVEKKIYSTPNITVVQQMRFINVIGEIRAPQRVPYTSDMTGLKAVSACGGFTDYANRSSVKILRGKQVIRFNALEALNNPTKDIPLQAGDQLQVPRTIF